MADVINLQEIRERKTSFESCDLNELIRRASLACKERFTFSEGKLSVIGEGQLKSIFESKITQEIFTRKLIDSDVFLCGIYVSNLLTDLMMTSPESWWAIDYAVSDEPAVLKKGGDACFIICGVFPERGNRRLTDVSYYQKMGAGFYYKFYNLAKREIGYHMSQQFETMVGVVQNCIHNF